MVLVDHQIRALAVGPSKMIEPFCEATKGGGVISYGLTSGGYDLRLAEEILLYRNQHGITVTDPKRFSDPDYQNEIFTVKTGSGNTFVLPANSYCLGRSVEYLRIPRHLKARCVGKSTLARAGILINTTPLEPEWEGHLTIEIGNVTPCPAVLYIGEGIAQLEFEELSGLPEVSYKDKGGVYQGSVGVNPSRIKQ